MQLYVRAALVLTAVAVLAPATSRAQINAGSTTPESSQPFEMTRVATFNEPWRIAFLPDGRMLITEKVGALWLVNQKGEKTEVTNIPKSVMDIQGGMLGVYLSPDYSKTHYIYLTYSEPAETGRGSGLALTRAKLAINGTAASLENPTVIWRDAARGSGGQFGATVAFSPDGKFLFLGVGERMRMTPAQDMNQPLGKILRLTLDGKPAPGNPFAGKTGASTIDLIAPARNTEQVKTAATTSTYTFPGPNLTPSEIWSSGHRNQYGLAFSPDGRLWEVEHGPNGGDELNLIEPGKNYGWPLVSYGENYDGVPIPKPDTHPELAKPVIYWTPVIAPGGFAFYNGSLFPQWKGSAFVTGLRTMSMQRITFDGKGGATPAERWKMGHQIRDIAVAPDGAIWLVEAAKEGGLFRLTPK